MTSREMIEVVLAVLLFVALKRHKRDHPKGVAMLIAGMMVTAFGLFITAFAFAFAFGEPVESMR